MSRSTEYHTQVIAMRHVAGLNDLLGNTMKFGYLFHSIDLRLRNQKGLLHQLKLCIKEAVNSKCKSSFEHKLRQNQN